jgi:large subunit ribosomal protein L29
MAESGPKLPKSHKGLGPKLKHKPEAKKPKAMSADELQAALLVLSQQRFKLRMQKAAGQLKQIHLLKVARRNIARIKFYLGLKKQVSSHE